MNFKSVVLAVCLGWLTLVSGGRITYAQPPAPDVADEPPGRRVFVPLDELQTLIQRDRNWVLMPRDEFKKLYAEAKKNTLDKPQPPQAVGVGDVKYTARIEEDQLVIVASLQVTKFAPGWQMLPLDFHNLSIEKATLGDNAARLGRDPQAGGRLVLLLDQVGKQTLTLELSRPLVAVGSDKLAAFGLAPLWAAEFVLDLPPEKHLQWNGVAVERPAANDMPAQFKLAFGGQKQIELRITDRPTLQSTDGLVFAHTALGLQAAPEEVTWHAVTSLQVFGKPLDQLQFRVPEALQIISITSPGLESWEFGPQGPENGETILNLRYRQAFQEPRDVTFQAVLATKTGESWQVPNLKLAGAASHVTQILANTSPGMRLQIDEAVGVQRTATDEEVKNPAVNADLRFSAWREDFVLRITTQSKAREISAAVVTLLDINQNGLDLQTRATVETRFAPLFEVSLTLPAEWTVTDVLVDGKRVSWESVPQEAGLHLLRVTFEKPLPEDGQSIIQLSAHVDPKDWPLEQGTSTVVLPEVRVLQTSAVEGNFVVSADRDLDVQPQELKGLAPTVLDPSLSARLSYEYQDTHYSGNVLVLRKPSRISVATFAAHRLDKETFFSHLEARLDIAGGGTRRIQVSLPETVGENLRFELADGAVRIVEQTAEAPANGRQLWTLLLDQRAHGEVLLYVDVSQPRKQTKEFTPPTLQVVGAERETGMISFEAESDQQLDLITTDADAGGRPLSDVDPTDLPIPTNYVAKERIVAAFSYVLPGYRVKLTERRFARMPVPTAICDRLKLVSILGETGELQHEATFLLRAVGVQSLQVTLPEKAQLWATLLDGSPIEVRQTKTAYLIPLMASSADVDVVEDPSRQRTMKLYYRTAVSQLEAHGTLSQTAPGITVLNGDGSEQPLEILQQEWTIHHPEQTEFVADPGSFIANEHQVRTSLLGDLLRQFQVDSPQNLLWKLVTLLILGGVVWILGQIRHRTGLKGLAALVAIVAGGMFVMSFLLLSGGRRDYASKAPATERAFVDFYQADAPASGATAATPATPPAASMPTSAVDPSVMDAFSDVDQPVPAKPARDSAKWMGEAKADDRVMVEELAKEEAKPADEKLAEEKSPVSPRTRKRAGLAEGESQERYSKTKLRSEAASESGIIESVKKFNRGTKDGEQQDNRQIAGGKEVAQAAQPGGEGGRPQQPMRARIAAPVPAPPGQQPIDGVPKPAVEGLGVPLFSKAVLSLALSLEPPAHSRSTTYTFRGRLTQKPPELIIRYQNRARLSFIMLAVQMVMILICWLIRQRTLALRGLVLALGIGLPLALTTVVGPGALPFLDGILCGTLLGVALWMIIALCQWFTPQRLWERLNAPLNVPVALLIAACLISQASIADAQEAPNQAAAKVPNDQLVAHANEIANALQNSNLAGYGIIVRTADGVVTLEGDVPTVAIRELAVRTAQQVPGVKSVVNNLTINEATFVVPFDSATDPLKSNRIMLPYNKFVELWKQAHPDEPDTTASPVAASIVEALYAAELVPAANGVKPVIKMTARYVCYSFREGQVTLPFPIGPVALNSAQLDGATAPLVPGNAQQPLAVVISKPGLHVVDLQFSIPAQITGPAGVFNLDLGDVPTGLVRFKPPAPDLNFRVNGSSGAFRKVGQGADVALLIPISQGGQFLVSWQPKQDRGDVAGIVHVDSTSALILSEEGPRLLSHWVYQVRQGSISEALFSLPPEVGVRKIEGQDVGGWEVAGEGEARQLKIFLRRKVEDSTQLKFDLFLKQQADDLETTYAVPQFAPLNITRETGTLAVLADKQFGLRVSNLSGLTQIEPQQVPLARLGTEFKSPVALAYRFANRPYELDLVANRRQPQLKVSARHYAHLDSRKVQQTNRFVFNLTGAPRAGISILIPQGYLLQNVDAADFPDWHISGREDSTDMDAEALLHLEFLVPRTGRFEVMLTGKTLRQPTDLKGEVSMPYPLEVDELDTQLLTTLDPIYTGAATMLDNWKSIDPASIDPLFPAAAAFANQLGFSSQTPAPAPIPFDLRQAQPRLSGQSLTLVNVGEESLDYLFALQWKITSAGADTFVFTTPDWLAGKLDFPAGAGPRRRSVTQESIDNGRTRWTITLEDPQRDRYFIVGRAVLPPSAAGEITAPGFIFEQIVPGQDPPQITPLETQTPYVVLVNQSQTQLTPVAPDSVEAIPADDLSRVIKIRQDLVDQAAEIVRVRTPGTAVVWKQQRFQAEQQLAAAVNLAHHVTVLAPDGSWREQVTYRLRNRRRQFLAVRLPADSSVLSLFVQGQPARPVQPAKELGFTLIPLPKTVEGDLSFEVHLVLAGQLTDAPLPRRWGLVRKQIDLPIPSVVSPEENAEYGIAVSQTTWTVYAPSDLDVDILQQSSLTNVNEVTATALGLDQEAALLSDATELIAINGGTFNRRVQAQSMNNLKQLKVGLNQLKNTNVATNPLEFFKQKNLQDRAAQLEATIDKLEVTNSAAGLTFQMDGLGNTIVIDEQTKQGGQSQRLEQLYTDNNPNNPEPTQAPAKPQPAPNTGKPTSGSGMKGNLNRENLRYQNFEQVQELAIQQKQSVEFDEAESQQQAETERGKPKAYTFVNPNIQQGNQQRGYAANAGQGEGFAPGQKRGLSRAGDYPRLGTVVGLDRQLQFGGVMPPPANDGRVIAQGPPVGMGQQPGPMVAGPGGMPGLPQGGGGGMGGGGMGGMGGGDQGQMAIAAPVWTTSGGLSLLIDIPTDGKVYNFSKVNGGARLSLGVRPHQTWQFALGLVWTVTWLVILTVIGWSLTRHGAAARLLHEAPWFLIALGTVTYFLVRRNADLGMFALTAFVVGALWLAFRKPAKALR